MALVLEVYGDEAGNMPVSDTDDVFVCAAVAALRPQLEDLPERPTRNPSRLVEELRRVNAHPSCAFVRPHPGYEVGFESKRSKLITLGLSTKRVTGLNAKYMPDGGLRGPNLVWLYSMRAAVAGAALRFVLAEETVPDRIEVFLDAKSLVTEVSNMLDSGIGRMQSVMRDVLRAKAAKSGALRRGRLSFLASKLGGGSTSISWADAPSFSGVPGALCLVDSLASSVFRELRRTKRRPGIGIALRQGGYGDCVFEMTKELTRPLKRESVQRWERKIGLCVPW